MFNRRYRAIGRRYRRRAYSRQKIENPPNSEHSFEGLGAMATDNWTLNGDGSWSTAANWSSGVPTSTSNVVVTIGNPKSAPRLPSRRSTICRRSNSATRAPAPSPEASPTPTTSISTPATRTAVPRLSIGGTLINDRDGQYRHRRPDRGHHGHGGGRRQLHQLEPGHDQHHRQHQRQGNAACHRGSRVRRYHGRRHLWLGNPQR